MEENETLVSVAAVIVTYNRLDLLRECIQAVLNQSYHVTEIVVVNNASRDGTRDYLMWLSDNEKRVRPICVEHNIGGAGGFALGIAEAVRRMPDYIWLMDDDTIPTDAALEELIRGIEKSRNVLQKNIGFAVSRALWKDGKPHRMNIPPIVPYHNGVPFDFGIPGILSVPSASFVSMLLDAQVIYSIGLPYRQYFIWGDDVEYSMRVTNSGSVGIYVSNSVVFHRTSANQGVSVQDDKPENAWRYFYNTRNLLHLYRKYNSPGRFMVRYLIGFGCKQLMSALLRKNSRWRYAYAVAKGLLCSFTFNPCVEGWDCYSQHSASCVASSSATSDRQSM